jgi:hypothetical protein
MGKVVGNYFYDSDKDQKYDVAPAEERVFSGHVEPFSECFLPYPQLRMRREVRLHLRLKGFLPCLSSCHTGYSFFLWL